MRSEKTKQNKKQYIASMKDENKRPKFKLLNRAMHFYNYTVILY